MSVQFFTAYAWGRASDRIGRRSVLVIAQLTAAASILLMGLSPTFALAFAARFVGGLFNSTTGTSKAVVADSFTPQQQVWGVGMGCNCGAWSCPIEADGT